MAICLITKHQCQRHFYRRNFARSGRASRRPRAASSRAVLQQIVVFLFPLQFEQAQDLFLLLLFYMSEEVAQEAPAAQSSCKCQHFECFVPWHLKKLINKVDNSIIYCTVNFEAFFKNLYRTRRSTQIA